MSSEEELPRPTDAELEILTVLWSQGPSTVRDVHATIARRKPAQVGHRQIGNARDGRIGVRSRLEIDLDDTNARK